METGLLWWGPYSYTQAKFVGKERPTHCQFQEMWPVYYRIALVCFRETPNSISCSLVMII